MMLISLVVLQGDMFMNNWAGFKVSATLNVPQKPRSNGVVLPQQAVLFSMTGMRARQCLGQTGRRFHMPKRTLASP